ncbi:L-2-hydroxyglutarate dehydrogenase, mitochondrial-like [Argiope bruennichi]|uniref:L-2-hydroxyglutarate dehydrogenase, mitochondrial n=1 Tax=Argiope bruennichi TaxID=94029 RepID=A0A8T0G105_ARGBR|nr:L-2-hydroxyglutarate dehydrogenase, mitochondrial-like [Argiope bruennichi]KAF8797034.1 L-2-hydroxyglutarate dehydrogenase like protein [Argiope bruennichi]
MQRLAYDVIVIGCGIIGTSTARELLKRNPALRLALIEKEASIGFHQSGHNSGVIHSGIYYTPGSLKAKLCVEGLELAYKYCDEKNIPYKKCGKLIVAVKEDELERLDALYKRAIENGVKDISLISREEIRKMEPNIDGLKAIWSPNTGIVDWEQVTKSYADDCRERGADIYLNFPVTGFQTISESPRGSIVVNGRTKSMLCKRVVTCGGLHSDKLAMMTGCSPLPRIIPFRGDYLVLKPEKAHLVKTNIYPVPYPDLPFLGVHITPRIDGSVWLGPNAVLASHQEGYRGTGVKIREVLGYIEYSGLRKLAQKHLGYGLREIYRGINISAQVQALRQYMPALTTSWVERGPSGVRAQALDADGNLVDDFIFDSGTGEFEGKVLHVRNAPSPGATSSLAIARMIVDKLEEQFHIKKL